MVVHSRARDHPQEYRHPLYLADWTRSIPYVDDLMAEDDLDEPHIKRKHVILQKYPQIKTLYGPEHRTKYIALLLVAVQLSLAYYFGKVNTNAHPVVYALTVYFVGASITQVFGTIIHEACHNLVANGPVANRVVAFMANIGIPFPIAASFRRYHLEHHAYQGVTGKDPDLPLDWEIRLCRGNPVFKILFLFFYPVMYVIRGLAMQKTPSNWELFNIAWTVTTDLLVYRYCGAGGFMYLFYSLWFGYGIHPGAAHFIQEHFTFVSGQETFSYYGVLNYPFLNIGYHTEHHDFAQVFLN